MGCVALGFVKSIRQNPKGALSKPKAIIAVIFTLFFAADVAASMYIAFQKKRGGKRISLKNGYDSCVSDLIDSPGVLSMSEFTQHGNVSCLEHCKHVSYYSYVLCRLLGLDYRSAARGGLLHDYFLYDWHYNAPSRWHGFEHPYIALENAKRDFELTETECDIIKKHMWPLTLSLPGCWETFIVSCVDKICTVSEVLSSKAGKTLSADRKTA